MALSTLAGRRREVLYAWGYGMPETTERPFFYRARDNFVYELRFIPGRGIANRFNYTKRALQRDAERLMAVVAIRRKALGTGVVCVGCSWGAAVIDCAMRHSGPDDEGMPDAGVAIAGPRAVLALTPRSPFVSFPLSENGDHGALWVQRHPHDPIGFRGAGPLLYIVHGDRHNYANGRGPAIGQAWMWGITGD